MNNEKKKILMITGTRADYGKIKSIVTRLNENPNFIIDIYVTGMHLLKKYGNTYKYILRDHLGKIYLGRKINSKLRMEEALATNIKYMSKYIKKSKPDMIIVQGDRLEALAGAIVGSFQNILVTHIEGGEISGTIDEKIRHSISKLSNFHFVANNIAKKRLIQMGENEKNIFVVGSPDIDIMLSDSLKSIADVKKEYNIIYKKYAISIYHPVTTNIEKTKKNVSILMNAIAKSGKNYIIIYPNNDMGTEYIMQEYKKYKSNAHIKFFKSIKFEDFITLLKNCEFVIGNSSAGIRECGVIGIPSISLGSRQNLRMNSEEQKNIKFMENFEENDILKAIDNIKAYQKEDTWFGDGHSAEYIEKILLNREIWNEDIQKKFIDIKY